MKRLLSGHHQVRRGSEGRTTSARNLCIVCIRTIKLRVMRRAMQNFEYLSNRGDWTISGGRTISVRAD